MAGIVIIGAGQAGAALAAKLRQAGHGGAITLIGAEPVPPYQRPPLSKAYLTGQMGVDRLFLRPESFYADHDITLRLGQVVTAIDPAVRVVVLADGTRLPYDQLALTMGASPRYLPDTMGGNLANVFVLRDLADADRLAPQLRAGRHVAIIGGGYIGLEAAAVCRKAGMEVDLIEAGPRILGRVACPQTADYFRDLHCAQGVRLHEGVGVEALLGQDTVEALRLSDGREIRTDLAIIGIGITPNDALAKEAGLQVQSGIVVDEFGKTSAPDIWAAGDCTSLPYQGHMIRLESVQNAIDQAEAVAENILGAKRPYLPKPWFWSDQYDVKLQIAGWNGGYDRIIAKRGAAGLSHWYFQQARLISVDAMNDPRAYMVGKRLIDAGQSVDPAQLAMVDDIKALLG